MRHGIRLLLLSAALAAMSCRDDGALLVGDRGLTPRASARVRDHDGAHVMLEYAGEPVTMHLDASHSSDPDGHILSYRWLSALRAAADGGTLGARRAVPDGEDPDWPQDVEQPEVTLTEGSHAFTLWVIDDRGNTSAPDTLRIEVATPLDGPAQACLESVADAADLQCARCVCTQDDSCRTAVSASSCNDTCWGLVMCIADSCPDFRPGGDTSCLTSKCSKFLSAGAAARALTPCLETCDAACGRTH